MSDIQDSSKDFLMDEPLVSVGIPTYNHPDGLRRALECISEQTYRNLEITVSDNCSPNLGVERVGREFAEKDPRIKYVRQEKNIGMLNNFEFVLDGAHGEYFMWAADDDEWEKTFIEILIHKLLKNSECNLAMCAIKRVDADTRNVIDILSFPECNNPSFQRVHVAKMIALKKRKFNIFYHGLFRKKFLMRCFPTPRVFGSDRLLILNVALSSTICYVDLPLYIRGIDNTPTYIKYPNEEISRISKKDQRSKKLFIEYLLKAAIYLYCSKTIPLKYKLKIPVILRCMYERYRKKRFV